MLAVCVWALRLPYAAAAVVDFCWPLLRPGGVLLGDDFNWKAVSHDAQLFARTHNLQLGSFDGCHDRLRKEVKPELCVWYLRKPADVKLRGVTERRPQLRQWRADERAWSPFRQGARR